MNLKAWHYEAIKLKESGLSSREIGKKLNRGKTSVNDLFAKLGQADKDGLVGEYLPKKQGPRILFLDIETYAMKMSGFGLFNQNFSIDQIIEDWSILSFCAKFAGEEEIVYQASNEYSEKEMLTKLWEMMNEAHYVCGHNSKRFDVKKIFSRMIINGMDRPAPFREIDTLEIAKRNFGMTSNKLAFLTNLLCKQYVKDYHGKFAGFSLWRECALGNPEAFEELRHYNIIDVLSLEELYGILAKWDTKLPVFEVHEDGVADMSNWEPVGHVFSNSGKFVCYQNKVTKQYRRSKQNLLSKEQRQALLGNIV